MAYDSKTYGQSPFGAPKKTEGSDKASAPRAMPDDGLDRGPTDGPNLADRFPTIPMAKSPTSSPAQTSSSAKATAAKSDAHKGSAPETKTSSRKSRASTKGASNKSAKRKSSKKAKAEAKAEAEAAELAVARRFFEEDRRAYLSLLYKTGISGLVWAVLRLLRHELSAKAIAIINTLIDPIMIATIALIGILGITFWARRLLNNLAQHTQRLQADAEATDDKSYRPTLEIVGDSLEYNPQLRKNLARLFNVTSILLCSLVSYLITFALFPTS
ncbi:MAG: hypothetical protein AAF703_08730 [Cyanobacteria bacterium P01_D01_bin.105]